MRELSSRKAARLREFLLINPSVICFANASSLKREAFGRSRVSLRLGPLAVLTVHRTVIHCRSCRFATPTPTTTYRHKINTVGDGALDVP